MKLHLRFFFISFILFAFCACTKEISKEGDNFNGPGTGVFYATINDKTWNADSLQSVLIISNGVSINGISKTGDQMSILLPDFKVGTYSLGGQSSRLLSPESIR